MIRRPGGSRNANNDAGSPGPGEPDYVVVGRLRRPHGVEGQILMEIITDFPQRLRVGKIVYVGEQHTPMTLTVCRVIAKGLLIGFEGCVDRDQIGVYTNQLIYSPANTLPELPEDEYYHHQLIGLAVENESGEKLGRLAEILETGANDVYVINNGEATELLLPAIADVILEVDLANGRMVVRPPKWE